MGPIVRNEFSNAFKKLSPVESMETNLIGQCKAPALSARLTFGLQIYSEFALRCFARTQRAFRTNCDVVVYTIR